MKIRDLHLCFFPVYKRGCCMYWFGGTDLCLQSMLLFVKSLYFAMNRLFITYQLSCYNKLVPVYYVYMYHVYIFSSQFVPVLMFIWFDTFWSSENAFSVSMTFLFYYFYKASSKHIILLHFLLKSVKYKHMFTLLPNIPFFYFKI